MKTQSIISVLCSLCILCIAEAGAQSAPVLAKGRLFYADGSHDDVYLMSYRAGTATYRTNLKSLNIIQVKKPKLESIYFYEPDIFSEAMRLYRAKNYVDARAKFAECEVTYKAVDSLPDNYATLAGFYKMECSRRLYDLDALSSELEKFRKDGLTRNFQFQQLEVYALWEAVRLKDWARLDRLAQSWLDRKFPSELRVQIEYCHALALEQLVKEDATRFEELIDAYSRVLSADASASIDLVLKAANSLLRIYAEDDEVVFVMKNWDPSEERAALAGDQKLIDAIKLVRYYQQVGFDAIEPLADNYEKFLDYDLSNDAPTDDAQPEEAEEEGAAGENSAVEE